MLKIKRFYPEPCRRICVGFKGVGRGALSHGIGRMRLALSYLRFAEAWDNYKVFDQNAMPIYEFILMIRIFAIRIF